MFSADSKIHYLLLVIFFVALSLRVCYLSQIAKEVPVSDELGYDEAAINIMTGKGFWMYGYRSYQPPLYPAFLAIIYRLFGHDYVMVKLIQMILGSFCCILLYSIAKMVFNRWIGLISAFIYALYNGFIFINGHLLTENLFIILELLFILLLLRFSKTKDLFSLILSGILIGLSGLTRMNVFISIPFICLWFLTISKKWPFYSLVLILSIGLTILPWSIRNYLIHNSFVPIASYLGESFFCFNYPNGLIVELKKERDRFKALGLKEGRMNSYYYGRVFEYIRNNPKGYLRDFFIKKLALNLNSFFFSSYIWFPCVMPGIDIPYIPLISWKMLSLFSLFGLLLSFRVFRRVSLLHYYFIPQIVLILTLFFTWTRFRLPIVPFFIIFSSFAIYSLFSLEYLKGGR